MLTPLTKNISLKTVCYLIMAIGFFNANSQIIIQDIVSGKNKEIAFGTKIFYKLFSDSTLGFEITPDYGIITTSYDSIIVFEDEVEINKNDISYLEIDRKSLKKWRGFAKPFLIAGMGVLSKGILMALGEGTESNNEQTVPIYLSIGSTLTGLSSIPFLKGNKSFDLTEGNYIIITP
jgi:hypothetical protein